MVNNENAFCLEGGTPSYENLALDVSVNSLFQADIMCTKRTETEIATTITKNNHLPNHPADRQCRSESFVKDLLIFILLWIIYCSKIIYYDKVGKMLT